MGFLSTLLAVIGIKTAKASSQACLGFFLDEEEMPRSLIK